MSGKKPDIKKQVMKAIESDELHMHSKNYFLMMNVLVAVATAAVVTLGIIIANTLVVDWQARDEFNLRGLAAERFGQPQFPWLLLVLTIILAVSAIYFVKKYPFGYKQRSTTLIVVSLAAVLAMGAALAQSNFGQSIAGSKPLRPLSPIHKFIEDKVVDAVIESIENGTITVSFDEKSDKTYQVSEKLTDPFEVGDKVILIFAKSGEEIIDIRKPSDFKRLDRFRGGKVKGEIKFHQDLY